MGTNFPASDDVFTEPSAPASTALGSAGDSTRDMADNHEDLGLAIMAMQTEATYVNHVHDGSSRNGPKLTQARTHENPDTDVSALSIHHTIGPGDFQASAGNHTHSTGVVWPVSSIFITEIAGNPNSVHGLPGTWTQIQGCFIVAAGSTFTAGTTGGNTTHTHTPSIASSGGHSHTSPNSDSVSGHTHTNSGTDTQSYGHTHGTTGSNAHSISPHYKGGSGTTVMLNTSHDHATGTASSTSHSHSVTTSDSNSSHSHSLDDIDTQGSHTHSSSMASSSHIPPYLSVYVWERTA